MNSPIKLSRVYSTEMDTLKEYIEALYKHDEDFESMIHIEEGVKSLLRNEQLATPYFIQMGDERVGYVILTKYHSVEKGGLTIYIDELYVEDRYRKKGIGGRVMEEILQMARMLGAKTLWAQTETYNKAAQSFFKGHGFRQNLYLNFERPL